MLDYSTAELLKNSSPEKASLMQQMEAAVKEKGFVHAWEKYLGQIVRLFHDKGAEHTLMGRELFALMQHSPELKEHFASLGQDTLRELAESFSPDKKPPKWDSVLHQDFKDAIHELYHENVKGWDEIKEADGSPVKVLENEVFKNWGRTVENIPKYTCFPRSIVAVQNIVKYAKANGKKVRVSGYRHTWGDLYSADDQILISTLSLEVATHLPAKHPPMDPNNDLQGIKMVGEITENGVVKGLCKIGAATTNEQFRVWATGENGKPPGGWTVPLNVIMVEITWGGSNAPVCHGAGLQHKTLSDLVYEIEYVDANGTLQTVSDPIQLKAASGCFGLLGVVTSVTLKLDKMTYANMRPTKERIGLAIPPPDGFPIPKGVDMSGISKFETEEAFLNFVSDIENSFYAEWFWFAFQKDCWINCWKNDGDKADSRPYPSKVETFIQETEEYIAQLITDCYLFKLVPAQYQARLLAGSAMLFLPNITEDDPSIVTPLIDGLHFRRGIQNLRVLDMEWEIPIPAKADDPTKADWSICQKAWWAVIQIFYDRYNADPSDVPMRLTMEMRITADSNVLMAPQNGNTFGTCSIEVLTILTTPQDQWQSFLQEVTTAWAALTDASGKPLNIRPHWAKQWAGLELRGKEIIDYLRDDAYKDKLPAFKETLNAIAQEQGFTMEDIQKRFSNPLIDQIFDLTNVPTPASQA